MPTEKKIARLVINQVDSEDTLKAMEQAGLINDDELYMVPDEGDLELDTTLTVEGGVPDSKAVGDRIATADEKIESLEDRVDPMETKLAGIADGATANTGTITGVSVNGTSVATSGVANIPAASTSKYGVTMLSSATNDTSTTLAATASAVKEAYDLAKNTKLSMANVNTLAESAYNLANESLPKAGGTMTGALTLAADPAADMQAATKKYVDTKTASLVDSAPETLNTLNKLSAALGDDPNFATTVATQIGTAQSTANTALDKANSIDGLPAVTTSDNDKFLRVVSGVWTAVVVDSAEEASF